MKTQTMSSGVFPSFQFYAASWILCKGASAAGGFFGAAACNIATIPPTVVMASKIKAGPR